MHTKYVLLNILLKDNRPLLKKLKCIICSLVILRKLLTNYLIIEGVGADGVGLTGGNDKSCSQ